MVYKSSKPAAETSSYQLDSSVIKIMQMTQAAYKTYSHPPSFCDGSEMKTELECFKQIDI